MAKLILPEPIAFLDRGHNLAKPRTTEEVRADLDAYLRAKRAAFEARKAVVTVALRGLLNRRGCVNLGLSLQA